MAENQSATGGSEPRQEIELKRRLAGEAAADALIAALGPVASDHRQVNHVFDTPTLSLRHSRHSLRLRDEDGAFSLTAKGPGRSVSGDVSTRTEAEASIERALAEQILASQRDPLAVLREHVEDPAFAELWRELERARGGLQLVRIGQFENRRRTVSVVIPPGVALHVEVDRTRFPGGQLDDELEIELPRADLVPTVEAWLAAATRAAGIETQASSPKLERFYAALAARSPAKPG